MKIIKIDTYHVLPRWLFLRIETDDGFVGWGEPVVEGRADTTESAVHELIPLLKGSDPRQVEDIWQTIYRGGFYRGGPVLTSALSGIDQALWDIRGKYFGAPVYDLLGGRVRDKMEVYSWIDSGTPEEAAACARDRVSHGFRNIKMTGVERIGWINDSAQISALLENVQAIRDAVGYEIGIAIDFHGRAHKSTAKTLLHELEPFKLLFVEEPVLIENEEAFAELHSCSNIPLATGERCYTRWDFKRMLQGGYVDIIQPDLSHAGGISEVRRIAAMAEACDIALAPHCPLGPIALASCLQVDFTSINACLQEQSLNMAYNEGTEITNYVKDPSVFRYENGFIHALTGPGLGLEINEKAVLKASGQKHHWKNPVYHMPDGSVTEW